MQVPDKVTDFAAAPWPRRRSPESADGRSRHAPTYSYMIDAAAARPRLYTRSEYPADYNASSIGGHAAHLTRRSSDSSGSGWRRIPPATPSAGGEACPAIHEPSCAKCDLLDGQRRTARESDALHVRPEGNRVQGRRRLELLTTAQVKRCEDLRRTTKSPDEGENLVAALSRQRVGRSFFIDTRSDCIATSTLRDAILNDPTGLSEDTRRFRSRRRAGRPADISRVNASNPDISSYVRNGGKLDSRAAGTTPWCGRAVLTTTTTSRPRSATENARGAVRLYMVQG